MIAELVVKSIKYAGWQNLVIITLLAMVQGTLALTVADLIGGVETPLLVGLALAGLLSGWLLASVKQIPGWLAGLILTALGLEMIVIYVANLEDALLNLAGGLGLTGWQLLPINGITTDWPFLPPLNDLLNGLAILFNRLHAWLARLLAGQPIFDPVIGALVWSAAIWSAAAWAGGVTRRTHRALPALLPAALLLALIIAYHPGHAQRLLVLIGATIPLIGLTEQARLEKKWQAAGIDTASYLPELLFAVLLITGGLLGLAWLAPSVSVWDLTRRVFEPPVNQVQPIGKFLGLNPGNNNNSQFLEKYRAPGLPRQHLLGTGPELSQQIVLVIDTGETPRPLNSIAANQPAPPHYYWRGLTYDRYTGRGWGTSRTRQIDYHAGDNADDAEIGQPLRQTVRVVSNYDRILYGAGTIFSADRPYSILWRGPADQFLATTTALTTTVQSRVLNSLSADDLRAAGDNYPTYVRQRYLTLPNTIPARILTLARNLTATQPTAYDRAKAIEAYLRRFPYSLHVPAPPPDRDVVDYFLFDLQTGYCDYYASAMVVLARAAGVPARLAVGYAPGRFDPLTARHIVTAADAHSWPEIYFPGQGWVEFEPTAAQPTSERTLAPTPPAATASQPPLPALPGSLPTAWSWLWPLATALLAGLPGLAATAWLIDGWRLRRLTPAAVVIALYLRLQQHGARLAIPAQPGDTPFEFAATFNAGLQPAIARRPTLHTIPAQIDQLTRLYVQTAYSHHAPQPHHKAQALQLWRGLRRRLWLLWLMKLIERRPH